MVLVYPPQMKLLFHDPKILLITHAHIKLDVPHEMTFCDPAPINPATPL
jgi:hypothetical protein